MIKTNLFLLLICSFSGPFICLGQNTPKSLYFDFGSSDSEVFDRSIQVTEETLFSPATGYGWLETPESSFVNQKFKRSRDAFTIDGVQGEKLEFQVDIDKGDWLITLYADAGYEDSSTVDLLINQKEIDPGWHAFQPSAEPYREIQTSYRIYQAKIKSKNRLTISLIGGDFDARLLGISLIPGTDANDDIKKRLVEEIRVFGKYKSTGSADSLLTKIKRFAVEYPNDPFYDYWFQKLELLRRAEMHFERRGWEKYIEITGLSIWGQLHQAVMILDGLLNHSEMDSDPLYERALFLRGRILYWLGLERGGPNEIARGQEDLARLYEKYPNDKMLAMYNGEQIDLPDPCDDLSVDTNAPNWSNKQRELLCRMKSIAHWWVLEQQAENGEFGGKLGDDVELLRWWTPLLLSGDSLAFVGWSKLADEIFRSKKVYQGYSKKAIDVEHASEFIADTAPLLVVYSDETKYVDRLKYSADYFRELWTGTSQNGNRFFRSAWFSSTEVDETPPRNRDHGYNSRAAKAVRYYGWKTGDPSTIQALNEWSEAWLGAASRQDKGKPAGILPASVRFPDEAFNGDGSTWYDADMFWEYFEWEANAGTMILDQLLYSYSTTRDEKFLTPLIQSLELVKKYQDYDGEIIRGSEAWAANILKDKNGFWSVAAQWRFMTGDDRFDDLLLQNGTPYVKYRLTGNTKFLDEGLEIVLENARYNTPLKTYEAVHTDRVYIRGYEHLTTMLTGNSSKEGLSPFFAVTWEDTDEGFTAVLDHSDFDGLKLQVYAHSDEQSRVTVRLWQLDIGEYHLIIEGQEDEKSILQVNEKGQRLTLDIAPKELKLIEIRK